MKEEWQYVTVYTIMIAALLAQVTLAVSWRTLGSLSTIGVLAIAGLQAVFAFLFFMHGKSGPSLVMLFTIISLLVLVPLFIALLLSVAFPQHAAIIT